jgi:hypothetical protein
MSGWSPIAASVPQRLFELVHTGEGRLHSALVARMGTVNFTRLPVQSAAHVAYSDATKVSCPEGTKAYEKGAGLRCPPRRGYKASILGWL